MNDHSYTRLGTKARTTKSTLRWITKCCAAVLLALALPLACTIPAGENSTHPPAYTPPASADAPDTPDIAATVEARVAATIEAEASIEAMVTTRLKATRAAEPSPTFTPQPTPSPTVAPTTTPTAIPLVTERRLEVGLNCDNVLRNQLIFQRGASTAANMNIVIAQIQAQRQECAKDGWKPVAIDMSDTEGLCYKAGGGFTAATDGKALKVGDQALPESLQRSVTGGQIPRYTSGRDSENNIIVYWSDKVEKRPSDGARCWLYYSRLRSWHENFYPAASKQTPIPLVTEWSLTGNWYRDTDRERVLTGVMKEIDPTMAYEIRAATLDATPGSEYTDLALRLTCIGPVQVADIMPYSLVLPEHVNIFTLGIWNESSDDYLPDHHHTDYNPVLTDDRSSISITNRAQLRQIMATLTHAAEKPQIDQHLFAVIGAQENENSVLVSEFDPAGLHDALQYLGCFHDMGSTEQSAPPDLQNYAARRAGGPGAIYAEETELTSITDLQNAKWLEHKYPETARRLAQLPWVKDGLNTAEEEEIIEDLLQILISQSRPGTLLLNPEEHPTKPLESILDMPFIQSISPGDAQAIRSLKNISQEDTTKLKTILGHPTFADGITDEWNPLIAALWGVQKYSPALVATLLDPERVSLESRTIELPLTGRTDLHIIRLKADGNKESMDRLEEAVRNVEFFMHLPLPTRMVAVLFADSVTQSYAGNNFGTSIAIKPEHEHDAENLPSTLGHEVAHYYWTGHQDWIEEGMANLIEAYHHWQTTGLPMTASKYPCPDADNIQELEGINPEEHQPAFRCNYTLGERLFLNLWNELGNVPFREGAQRLYERSEEGTGKAGIAEVREAFNDHPHVDSWYNSPNPRIVETTTGTSPTWRLDEIHGTITKAGIVLRMDEPPVTSFSARSHTGWAYFQFHYEYPAFQEESWTVNLLMTQTFEDGFTYDIRPLELNVRGIHVGGSWALSVGPGPGERWKPGKHRVTLHDGSGNKVAEARWTVTH